MRARAVTPLALIALAGGATGALADHKPGHKLPPSAKTTAPGQVKPKTEETTPTTTSETTTPETTTPTVETPAAPALDPVSEPVAGESAGIAPASGTVRVKLPGTDTYVDLGEAGASIPMGAKLDATEGAVKLTTTAPDGGTQAATFRAGAFEVTQSKKGIALLRLTGGDFSACDGGARAASFRGKARRRIWGKGHGRFRTRGRYSAATVRGTVWKTEDRCEGTLTVVRRGVVSVFDRVKGKHVRVKAGERYFARKKTR
jgi:hypothetical protein